MERKSCATGWHHNQVIIECKKWIMKKILQQLFEHKILTRGQARELMLAIGNGQYTDAEIASFTTVYLMRSITIEELAGFREALLEICLRIHLNDGEVLDMVGTGGDGKNTFNISTLSCFIAAGAGVKVAKHGNYGVSSVSGSSNVMEAMGYRFSSDAAKLQKELDTANICFLHAPLFHPALKAVAGVRRSLGLRTFFNMLGPVVNPAMPLYQVIGVYNPEIARYYNYLLQQEHTRYVILHTLDGYDEISLTDDAKIITRQGEKVMSPEALGKRMVQAADIFGGNSIEEAAALFQKILKGEGSWAQNNVVLANAALAIQCRNDGMRYETAFEQAIESFESRKAWDCLQTLLKNQ
jgi:anthranilate phosphoribosyltransferase